MTEDEHAFFTAGALSQNDKIEALQEEIAELKRSREGLATRHAPIRHNAFRDPFSFLL